MADLLVFFWVSVSMGVVLVDALSGLERRNSVLPPASEVAIA